MSEAGTICWTDAPRVVRLKREFYALDLRLEEIKAVVHPAVRALYESEMQNIFRRKAVIAREIFGGTDF